MRLRALLLAALAADFSAAWGEECPIGGIVLDADSGAPIEEALLTLRPLSPAALPGAAITGPDGRFCFPLPAPGRYLLTAVWIGHGAAGSRSASAPLVLEASPQGGVRPAGAAAGEAGELEIETGERPTLRIVWRLRRPALVERVEVVARERPTPRGPPAPARSLSREEILATPGSLDDAARALASLPGVSTINDYKGVLRLGGSEPEDSLFLIDGVVIENPYHFHWSRGSAGAFGASAFDRATVRTSGLGADIGDTIGGVIEIDPSERGSGEGFLDGSFGTLLSSFTAGGKLAAGSTATPGDGGPEVAASPGSWLASSRYSNLALYRSLYGVEKIEAPDFGDLVLRLRRPLGPGAELVAGGLALTNSLQTSDPDEDTWEDIRARAGGAYAGVDLEAGPDSLVSARLSWWGARQRYDTSAGDRLDASDRRLHLAVRSEGGGRLRWRAGAEAGIREGVIAGALETTDELQPLEAVSSRWGAYAAAGLGGGPGWTSEVGVRADRDSRFGAAPAQPRLRLEYASAAGWSARLGAGRYAQFPRLEQEFLAGGEALAVAVSDEIGAGVSLPLPAGFDVDLAVYERRMRDLTSEIVNRSPDLRERTGRFERGRSRTLEVSVRHAAGRLRSRLSTTLVDARQTRDGATSPRNGDQPYLASLTSAWSAGGRWTLLGRFQAGAGLPYSAMEPGGEEEGDRTLGPLNGRRLPAFSRLDLRVVWERPAGAARMRAHLEVANALGRRNVRGRDLRWDPAAREYYFRNEESMPLVPGFGVSLSWRAGGDASGAR
jgi:hypothetical protein